MVAEPCQQLRLEQHLIEGHIRRDELDRDLDVLLRVATAPDLAEVSVPEMTDEPVAVRDQRLLGRELRRRMLTMNATAVKTLGVFVRVQGGVYVAGFAVVEDNLLIREDRFPGAAG